MPDTFIRFSDMKDSHPSPIDGANDLLAIAHKDINSSTGYNSMTVTPNALGAHAVEDQTFVNLETGAKTVEGAINQTLGNFANKYDQTQQYAVNDCVLYAGILYKCIVAISTPEAWDSTHWEQIKAIDVGSGGGGSSADHITLTQAEYDALVEAGTVDPDAFYFIKDTSGDGQNFQPVIYSLEEREIGVWTDGKPLYERTITITASSSEETIINHNISNADYIYVKEGTLTKTNNSSTPCETYHSSSSWACGIYDVNRTSFTLFVGNNLRQYVTGGFITFRYTKTTDQAGSGTWTPQGVPAVHYSTDEQIVGTWIDGKPVYEKTFQSTTPSAIDTVSIIEDISSLNVDIPILLTGNVGNVPINWKLDANNEVICFVNSVKTGIAMKIANSLLIGTACYLTLRYTKSST